MKYEITVKHETVYVIDDSTDACYIRELYDVGDIASVTVDQTLQPGGAHTYRAPLPDWILHELKVGRLGELLESARANGCEVIDDGCEECGDSGIDPDAKGPDGRSVCDRCRDEEAT